MPSNKKTLSLLALSLGAALLAAPTTAMPLPTASLTYNGTINLQASAGLSLNGDVNAQYRSPVGSPPGPYQFNTSLDLGPLSINPELSVTTPEIVLIEGGETCIPVLGCFPLPDITLPSQEFALNPSFVLSNIVNVYDYSYTSGELPLGDIFGFDFGTPLFGGALTVDDLVQNQFDAGATSVSETGSVIGPFTSSYQYSGLLQPDGNTILGSYELEIMGPGLLADLETALLEIINDNTAALSDLALQGLLASNPCSGLPVGQDICVNILSGLDGSELLIAVNSIGNFSSDFSLHKSIIPLAVPVPAPASLSLLFLGMFAMGLNRRRSRRRSTP